MVKITNENIREIVRLYIMNKIVPPGIPKNISSWDVSEVTDFSEVFAGYENFNKPLKWEMKNATNMCRMFSGCREFNQDLKWDVGNVTDMSRMFTGCNIFNGKLSGKTTAKWDVSKVTNMESMFSECYRFEGKGISNWNVTNVTNMASMFNGCSEFERDQERDFVPLNWDVSNVIDMSGMFESCYFKGDGLTNWNVTNVVNMDFMFANCDNFNVPLTWNLTSVTNMDNLFYSCERLNSPIHFTFGPQPILMRSMFHHCRIFNQDLRGWNIPPGSETRNIFTGCPINGLFQPVLPASVEEVEQPAGEAIERPVVDAYAVHAYSSKIDLEGLNEFLKSKTSEKPKIPLLPIYIQESLAEIVKDINKFVEENNILKMSEVEKLEKEIGNKPETLKEKLEKAGSSKEKDEAEKLYQRRNQILTKIHFKENKPMGNITSYLRKIKTLQNKHKNHEPKTKKLKEEYDLLNELKTIQETLQGLQPFVTLLKEKEQIDKLVNKKNGLEFEIKDDLKKIGVNRLGIIGIMSRINNIKIQDFPLPQIDSIYYSLEYVKKQPILFKRGYLDSFVKDCVHAYEGSQGMSCGKGIIERFVLSLLAACEVVLSLEENRDYEHIKNLINNSIEKVIPEQILLWIKKHSVLPYRFSEEISEEDRRKDLIDSLKQRIQGHDKRIEELVNISIDSFADDLFNYKPENVEVRNSLNLGNIYEGSPINTQISHAKNTPFATRKYAWRNIKKENRIGTSLNGPHYNAELKENTSASSKRVRPKSSRVSKERSQSVKPTRSSVRPTRSSVRPKSRIQSSSRERTSSFNNALRKNRAFKHVKGTDVTL